MDSRRKLHGRGLKSVNATSEAIIKTVLATDGTLTAPERAIFERLMSGQIPVSAYPERISDESLAVTQKRAARILGVSRVTLWRMVRDGLLHPVEIFPGILRYPIEELTALTRDGWKRSRVSALPDAVSGDSARPGSRIRTSAHRVFPRASGVMIGPSAVST